MYQKVRTSFQDFKHYIPSLTSFGGEKTARILSLVVKRSDKFLHFVSAPFCFGNLTCSTVIDVD